MSVEYEPMLSRNAYLDPLDNSPFSVMDSSMDFLHNYDAPSPNYGGSLNLTGSASPSMDFQTLHLSQVIEPSYTFGSFAPSSTARPYSPGADSSSISPSMPPYQLSGGEMSDDSTRRSRGEASVPHPSTIPRSAHRFNPISMPATRASARAATRRRSSRSSNDHGDGDSDAEEEEDYQPGSGSGSPDLRREAVRRQRIESEQRRRDELREGYARLKAVLPPSSSKSSKVNLLDRAALHLKTLEERNKLAEQRFRVAEAELVRVRSVNEVLSLRAVQRDGMHAVPNSTY